MGLLKISLSLRIMRLLSSVILSCILSLSAFCGAAEFSKISRVRSMTTEELAKGGAVTVRGVITMVWREGTQSWVIQDDTAGIWVGFEQAKRRNIWKGDTTLVEGLKQGDLVVLEAMTDVGGFAPVLLPRALRIEGKAELPPAVDLRPEDLLGGSADSQRVKLRGVVRDSYYLDARLFMHVESISGAVTAQVSRPNGSDPTKWINCDVEFTGVGGSVFNGRSEFMELTLLTESNEDIRIIEKPSGSPPRIALRELARFSPEGRRNHLVKVEGTVTLCQKNEYLYLQEGNQGIRVRFRSSDEFKPGDRVEATGFVGYSGIVAEMVNATIRKIASAAPPPPRLFSPDILSAAFDPMEQGARAAPTDLDAMLVTADATLIAMQAETAGSVRLVLDFGDRICFAVLRGSPAGRKQLEDLRTGSLIRFTGVTKLDYQGLEKPGSTGRPKGFEFELRTADDIVVLEAASWWTRGRVIATLGVVATVFALTLLWVWLLHRQVREQTHQIASEIKTRGDAAVEFRATMRERNRLAANLHDTLLQTLGGVNFQLDACEITLDSTESRVLPSLEVARRMVNHAVNELRGSVWALRSIPLHEGSFPDALKSLCDVVSASLSFLGEILLKITDEFERIPNFVAGNILLVVQESLYNAIRHGRPTIIEIHGYGDSNGSRIVFEIRDNGDGFEMGSQAGPTEGHFGIPGMIERAERLGGTLRISSSPGQGTLVRMMVQTHALDDEVA